MKKKIIFWKLNNTLYVLVGNQLHTILTGPVITAAMGLPANLASTLLQQHVNSTLQGQALAPLQVSQPLQVVTQNANNVSQRSVPNQVINRNDLIINLTFTLF